MLLTQLVNALPVAQRTGPDVEITDIAYDSREVTPGALFVAVPTVGGDPESGGARFIAQAAQRGAVAVVGQMDVGAVALPVVRVADARAALADLAAEFFGHPSELLNLFAVTGTDGKTTTTYLLEQVLAHAGFTTGLIGTIETKIGAERFRNADRMTTPESLDIQRLLRRMVDAGVTHAVMEASSHALALDRLRGCRPVACAVTNITADHLEFHGSWEEYFGAKSRLFTEVGRGRPAVLNRDDPCYERLEALATGNVVSYGGAREAHVRATQVTATRRGTRFILSAEGTVLPVEIGFGGDYNVSNALAAAGLARCAGLDAHQIAAGLESASLPPGRLQPVTCGQSFDVLIDYAHTVNAFQSVLSAIRGRTSGRLIAVFGAAGNRDRAKRPEFARIAARYSDLAIVTNEDPFGEQPDAIIDEVLAGVPAGDARRRFVREPDRGRAIERALQSAARGDAVLILGKGHEQNIVVNGIKVPWSDAEVATGVLERLR